MEPVQMITTAVTMILRITDTCVSIRRKLPLRIRGTFCFSDRRAFATVEAMNRTFAATVAVLGLLLSTAVAQDKNHEESPSPSPELKEEILYSSPKGTYRIQATEDGESTWIVSAKDLAQRNVLRGATERAINASASPDEKWLFYGDELYHDAGGLKFTPSKNSGWFRKNAVVYGAKKIHLAREDIAASQGDWSFDSNRLLIALSAGDEERYVYFDTRTGGFEQTPYLRMVNKLLTGAERFDAYPGEQFAGGGAKHMVFAEPVDRPPTEAELRARFETLDAKMNNLHKKFLEQADADWVLVNRESQQRWLKAREDAAKKYLPFAPKAGQERFRLQFLCELTGEEVRQLQGILGPDSGETEPAESTKPSGASAEKVVYESPNGTYRIQTNEAGRSFWVVSTENQTDRNILLGSSPGHHPEFNASPNGKWLFADYHGLSELYEDRGGLKFAPFKQEQWFSKNAEAYAAKNFHLAKKEINSRGYGWSFDSSRLLIKLEFWPGWDERCLYFNTRTGALEETPYLLMVNKRLAEGKGKVHTWASGAYPSAYFARWLRYMVFVEPLDAPPSEDVLKTGFDAADEKMNKVHQESLVWVSDEKTKNDRRGYYEQWAKARNDAVQMYLPFAPKTEEECYRLLFLCDLTDEEIREAQLSQREGRSR